MVASANPGVGEYLASGESMLTAEIGDGEGLGEAALNVLSNPTLRSRLSQGGQQGVASYSWRESTDRLEAVLQDLG